MANTPTTPADPAAARPVARRETRQSRRGQSLAEFAITLPMALLMILFGLDFGRVFLGWVALHSAAREAANYAAMNPTAWASPPNAAVQIEYARLVTTEASHINCTLDTPISDPSFPNGTSIGAPVQVELDCAFDLITPFIGILVGNPMPVSASSAFPVRSGYILGVPVASIAPTASPAPSSSAVATASPGPSASVNPSASPSPSATATATATPTPGPTPNPTSISGSNCTVPSLLSIQTTQATGKWSDAGFTGAVIFSPLVPPHYRIEWQSLTVGMSVACTSGITVRSSAP
jgi:hypothetical protein